MKNIIKYLLLSFLLTTIVLSCKKDEKKVYFEGGTAPVLAASSSTISLTFATAANVAVTFSWTNPNYQFNTGISSQDVFYVLQIDTTGSNFTNPNLKSIAISKDLKQTITVGDFNDYLLNQLALKPGMNHNLDIRIKSTLLNSSVPLYSNVLKFTVKPYAIPPKVTPPATGELWVTGNAFASGWSNPLPSPYDVSQKFTRVDPTTYTLTVSFIGGGGYKIIQAQGNWDTQYHAIDGTVFTGGDFELKNSDPQFPGAGAAGTYKITVDFQRGKYFVEKI